MPEKLGNGGHSQEAYDPNTGRYVKENTISNQSNNKQSNFIKGNPEPSFLGKTRNIDEAKEKIKNLSPEIFKNVLSALRKSKEARKQENYNAPFNKKDRDWSLLEDIISVNPKNGDYSQGIKYTHNCQRCVPTFVARFCWGLDVEANSVEKSSDSKRNDYINPYRIDNVYSVYENANPIYHLERKGPRYRQQSWSELDNYMNNLPEKAVVQVLVEGHTFCVLRTNGRNYCIEPQVPSYYKDKDIFQAMDDVDKSHRSRFTICGYCRVDDLKPSRRFWDVCHNREERE